MKSQKIEADRAAPQRPQEDLRESFIFNLKKPYRRFCCVLLEYLRDLGIRSRAGVTLSLPRSFPVPAAADKRSSRLRVKTSMDKRKWIKPVGITRKVYDLALTHT